MSFDGQIFDKKITVREENSLTPKEVEIIPGGTADTKTTLVSSQTTDKTLTLPDLNDTLVGLAGAQTLTNKTLVAANNTITTAASGVISSTELNSVIAEVAGDLAQLSGEIVDVAVDLQDHIDDPTGAHAATAISFSDVTYPGVTNVSEALLAAQGSGEVTQQELEDHIADTETHGATGAIVGTTNTQTLTNKTLTSPVINSPTGIVKGDVGLGNVDNTSDATKNSATATLTNKTIVAANNTITTTAYASQTNLNSVITAIGSDMTTAQNDINALDGQLMAHEANTGSGFGVHGATGAVVGTTNTQTLTNKTLTSPILNTPTINSPSGLVKADVGLGNVDNTSDATKNAATVTLTNKTFGNATTFAQLTTPSTPAAGFNVIYPKADGSFYNLNSAGVELPLGSGSGGGGTKNYLASVNGVNGNGNFELGNTTKWNLFSTTMTGKIPTGTIAAPGGTIDSFTAISSNVLAGTYSGQINASGAISPGDGVISDAFTLDAEDVAKPFSASFYYQALGLATPGTSSNSFAVYLYDVANSAWVQPSNVYGINQSTNIGKWAGEFQTSSNATTYRIALICITVTSGLPVELRVDDFSVGPSIYNQGTPVTDWQAYTATVTGMGTIALIEAFWARVGGSIAIRGKFSSGTVTGAVIQISLPPGLTVSPTLETNGAIYGSFIGSANSSIGFLWANGNNKFVTIRFANTFASDSIGTSWTSSATYTYHSNLIPILGWSSSVQMSDSADTRVVDFVGYPSVNQALTANVTNINLTATKDSHGVWTGSTYVVPVPGDYSITASAAFTTNSVTAMNVYVNTVLTAAVGYSQSATSSFVSGATIVPNLKAGDIVSFRISGSLTIGAGTTAFFTISKLSGPSAIAESERIACRYTNTAGTVVTTSYALIPFATKDYDTHGAFSAGIFTAPAAGEYQVILCLIGTTGGSPETIVALYKNGSHYSRLADNGPSNGSTGLHGSDTVMLLAGETLGIYSFASSNNTLSAVAGLNHVTFRRVK